MSSLCIFKLNRPKSRLWLPGSKHEIQSSHTIPRQYIIDAQMGEDQKKKQPQDAALVPIPGYKQNIKQIATGMPYEDVRASLTFGPKLPDGRGICWLTVCLYAGGHRVRLCHGWENMTERTLHNCKWKMEKKRKSVKHKFANCTSVHKKVAVKN